MLTSGNTEVNKVRFNVSSKVNEMLSGFQIEAKRKNLELNTAFSDTTALNCCVTDPQLLEKILTQLIENAIKFTNKGKVEVGLRALNTDLLVSVSDTGIGIADEHKDLVFQYFTQEIMSNNRPYDGTGLGLNIANRLVELLGGKIWLESQKDKGTQVSFLLPEALCATEQPKKSASEEAVYMAKTVLIAEDDDINFSYLNILLKSDKVVTLRAKNGLEAVEKVRNHPEIFLVLMDLKMPEMSGFDATRSIRAIRPELPVLAVTAYSANNDIQAAREAGCVDYIVKPIRKEQLIRKLTEFGVQV
jgi:CheY-like chemotaxis protein